MKISERNMKLTDLSNLDEGEIYEMRKLSPGQYYEFKKGAENAQKWIENHPEEIINFKKKFGFENLQK